MYKKIAKIITILFNLIVVQNILAASLKEELYSTKWILSPQDKTCDARSGSFITYAADYGRVFTIRGKQGLPPKKPSVQIREVNNDEIVFIVNFFGTEQIERMAGRSPMVSGSVRYQLVRGADGKIRENVKTHMIDIDKLMRGSVIYNEQAEENSILIKCS